MNLGDISERYQKNLMEFFNDDRIIEYIYIEQYGEENYIENKEKYHEEFKEIMANTVFIPYITLEHFEQYIQSIKRTIKKKKREQLQGQISDEKQKIIQERTEHLIEELKHNYPSIFRKKKLPIITNSSVDTNIKVLFMYLKNSQQNNNSLKIEQEINEIKKHIEEYEKNTKREIRKYEEEKSEQYAEEQFKKEFENENKLYRRLISQKRKIIKEYTETLLEDLKEILPDSFDRNDLPGFLNSNSEKEKQQFSNMDFNKNYEIIQNYLNQKNHGLLFKLKKVKINRLLREYKKNVDEKILIETSSFFNHRADIPSDKYYSSLIDVMTKQRTTVRQKIGRVKEKNCRYIYLPIFRYFTKKDYLNYAVHEVMHISKEKLVKNTYRSGFVERKIPHNKMSGTPLLDDNFFRNLFQSFRWLKFKGALKTKKSVDFYHASGSREFEEAVHQWQVRDVVDNIISNGLDSELYMPYSRANEFSHNMVYENADIKTQQFMQVFSTDVQKVNSGEMSVREFKHKVGKSNFELLDKLYEEWISNNSDRKKSHRSGGQSAKPSLDISFDADADSYSYLGDIIIHNMIENSKKVENRTRKREEILEKTKRVLATDIYDIGKLLVSKLRTRKNSEDNFSKDRGE